MVQVDSKFEKDFLEYLSELGFPAASILYEPVFQSISNTHRYRPDFALIDLKTKEPLAIIEVKGRQDSATLNNAISQVKSYLDALNDKTVKGFVVTPSQSGQGFDFFAPDENGLPKQVPSSLFLQLESLSSARIIERKEILVEQKKQTIDNFQLACYLGAGIAFIIACADFILSLYEITLLTTERMALIGATIALLIIPFVQKFKGLGLEIERANKLSDD